MSVITKESLIRGYFSLSAPIKYACGCIVFENESELEWLAQCGYCPKVQGSIPGGCTYFWISLFCMAILHATVRNESAMRARAWAHVCFQFWRGTIEFGRSCHSIFHFFGPALVHATFGIPADSLIKRRSPSVHHATSILHATSHIFSLAWLI